MEKKQATERSLGNIRGTENCNHCQAHSAKLLEYYVALDEFEMMQRMVKRSQRDRFLFAFFITVLIVGLMWAASGGSLWVTGITFALCQCGLWFWRDTKYTYATLAKMEQEMNKHRLLFAAYLREAVSETGTTIEYHEHDRPDSMIVDYDHLFAKATMSNGESVDYNRPKYGGSIHHYATHNVSLRGGVAVNVFNDGVSVGPISFRTILELEARSSDGTFAGVLRSYAREIARLRDDNKSLSSKVSELRQAAETTDDTLRSASEDLGKLHTQFVRETIALQQAIVTANLDKAALCERKRKVETVYALAQLTLEDILMFVLPNNSGMNFCDTPLRHPIVATILEHLDCLEECSEFPPIRSRIADRILNPRAYGSSIRNYVTSGAVVSNDALNAWIKGAKVEAVVKLGRNGTPTGSQQRRKGKRKH